MKYVKDATRTFTVRKKSEYDILEDRMNLKRSFLILLPAIALLATNTLSDQASERYVKALESGDSAEILRAQSYIAPPYCYDLNPWHGVTFETAINGRYVKPVYHFEYQDMAHIKVRKLYDRAGIAAMEKSADSELDLIQSISDWVNSQWGHMQPLPYPTWDAHDILDRAEKGDGFWCTFKAALFVQACNSAGLSARILGINQKHRGAHTVAEVYSNQFRKWILVDAWLNCYYERNGQPLSAREFHDSIGNTKGIHLVFGKNGRYLEYWNKKTGKADTIPSANKSITIEDDLNKNLVNYYHDIRIVLRNDHTVHPQQVENVMVDGFMVPYNSRGGEYWGPQLHWTDDRTAPQITSANTNIVSDFEWPLNEVKVDFMRCSVPGEKVVIELTFSTLTPSFSHYRLNVDGTDSELDSGKYVWSLIEGRNTLSVASVNAVGREGFASEFVLNYDPSLVDFSRKVTVEVPNPGFEKSDGKSDRNNPRPEGWHTVCSNALQAGEFQLDSKVKHSGKHSLRVSPAKDKSSGLEYALIARASTFEINPSTDMIYTVWLRADNDGTPVDICLLDSTSKGQGTYVKRVTVGTKWAKYTLPCRIHNEITKAYVGFKVYTGTVWADDIALDDATVGRQ